MDTRSIKKRYEQACTLVLKKPTEENKQAYLVIFKELDNLLNVELSENFERFYYPGKNLIEEMARVKEVISLFKHRLAWRNQCIEDFNKLLGYKPYKLIEIPYIDEITSYENYLNNIKEGSTIIKELMASGKKIKTLTASLDKKKNISKIRREIESLKKERTLSFEKLKCQKEILDDLYNYCIAAPFSEENAYIQYILIKLHPKSELKIDLNTPTRRILKKREPRDDEVKLKDKMPEMKVIGSVKPNNILKHMEDAQEEFDDISLPNHGLLKPRENIKMGKDELS